MPVSMTKLIATGAPFASAIEFLRFVPSGDRGNKSTLDQGGSFLGQGGTENNNRLRNFLPQNYGLFQVGHAEELRLLPQRLRHTHHAVAVGIRLDDREQFHARAKAVAHDAALCRNAL